MPCRAEVCINSTHKSCSSAIRIIVKTGNYTTTAICHLPYRAKVVTGKIIVYSTYLFSLLEESFSNGAARITLFTQLSATPYPTLGNTAVNLLGYPPA